MTGNTHLFLGGARSGKSALALSWANFFGPRRFFLATAEALDGEMSERIALHQAERAQASTQHHSCFSPELFPESFHNPLQWHTIEEPLDIAMALKKLEGHADIVLVDCLTMWVSNQIFCQERSEQKRNNSEPSACFDSKEFSAAVSRRVLAEFENFCTVLNGFSGAVALVSNELGLGLVPDNRLGRVFRDLAGKVNQMAAENCAHVTFVAAGLPLALKRNGCAQALI